MDAIDELLSTTHELKTPIVAISRLTKILLENHDSLSEDTREKLRLIRESAEEASDTLQDLDLPRRARESGGARPGLKGAGDDWPPDRVINLADTARSVVERYRSHAHQKDQSLDFAVGAGPGTDSPILRGKPKQIRKSLANLVSNAIKYGPPGSSISVGVGRADDQVFFSVQDEGPGLTERDQDRIFQFQTVGKPTPTGEGTSTGIGLYLVQNIVDRHGGSVAVESERGAGSTFTLYFPSAGSGDRRRDPAPARASRAGGGASSRSPAESVRT